jgi:hypothetical protein
MAADTSSSAAASTPVVWVAAAELAALTVEPIFAKSVAAASTISGAAITYDMSVITTRSLQKPSAGQKVSREPVRSTGDFRRS